MKTRNVRLNEFELKWYFLKDLFLGFDICPERLFGTLEYCISKKLLNEVLISNLDDLVLLLANFLILLAMQLGLVWCLILNEIEFSEHFEYSNQFLDWKSIFFSHDKFECLDFIWYSYAINYKRNYAFSLKKQVPLRTVQEILWTLITEKVNESEKNASFNWYFGGVQSSFCSWQLEI